MSLIGIAINLWKWIIGAVILILCAIYLWNGGFFTKIAQILINKAREVITVGF